MRLLIVTQKVDVNDDILGFFHRWIEEFAKHCELVTVICLSKGENQLPSNVRVYSLGKEEKKMRWHYLWRFYKYIFQESDNYDKVFVHMNKEYVLLGGWLWHWWGKKTALWYVHKKIDWQLKMAEKLVSKIFTVSKESCRLESKKIVISGHGIDCHKFKPVFLAAGDKIKIIVVSRISPVKNIELLIEAAKFLKEKNLDFEVKIAGAPINEEDSVYLDELLHLLKKNDLSERFIFSGPMPYKNIENFYKEGNIFVNLTDTGSFDKSLLEAMASGLRVLTSNQALRGSVKDRYLTNKDPKEIANRIIMLSQSSIDSELRDYVQQHHNLENLIKKIVIF